MTTWEPSPILDAFLTAFPAPEDVFSGDVSAHRRVLQPLLSIDASTIDSSWSGRLHIVTPLEPYDGLIGDETTAFHSGYCVSNWIAFKVVGSKYEFLGDFRYFLINAKEDEFYRADYEKKERSFEERLRHFRATGLLGKPDYPDGHGNDWLVQLGGAAGEGNWCSYGLPVETEEGDDEEFGDNAFPLTSDGRRFRFVASLNGFNYRDNCADEILLFFDPETSTAVLTFDWT